MGNVATISAAIKADVSNFESGINRARKGMKDFKQEVPAGNLSSPFDAVSASLTKFEVSGRAAKKSLAEVAHTMGSVGGPAMDFVKYSLMMGPALGGAIAAVAIYNDIMTANAERTKEAKEELKSFNENMRNFGLLTGEIKAPEIFSEGIAKNIEEDAKALEKLSEAFDAAGKSWTSFFTASGGMKDIGREIDKRRDAQNKKLKAQQGTDETSQAFNSAKSDFDVKVHVSKLKDSPAEGQRMEMEAAAEYAKKLDDILHDQKTSQSAFNTVHKEYLSAVEREAALKRGLAAQAESDDKRSADAKKHIADEQERAAKQVRENWSRIEQQAENMDRERAAKEFDDAVKVSEEWEKAHDAAAEKIKDQLQTPVDVFKKNMEEAAGLFLNKKLTADQFEKYAKKQQNDLLKSNPVGFGKTFDTSLINIKSYAGAGGPNAEQAQDIKEMKEVMKDIRKNTGIPQPQLPSRAS